MSIMMYVLRHTRCPTAICTPKPAQISEMFSRTSSSGDDKTVSPRMAEFKKKLQEEVPFTGRAAPEGRQVTPIKKLDQKTIQQPKRFEYPAWPDNTNPETGEVGGPRGPEPTRYGDWERKGRCSDF